MLNQRQEKFITNLLNGMSQREAYKDAYNAKYKDESIDSKASVLFNSEKVQERYKELREKILERDILTAQERMKFLSDVVTGKEKEETYYYDDGEKVIYERPADINSKIKAIDTLNKMTGEYVQKVELDNTQIEVSVKVIE